MHEPAASEPRRTSAIRHASRGRRLLVLLPILIALLTPLFSPATGATQATTRIDEVKINGTVTGVTRDIVERAIDQAEGDGSTLLMISLRSAGGNESAANDIVNALSRSTVPVVVWVPDGGRVRGAAVRILIGAPIAAMAPNATIGDTSQRENATPDSASDREAMDALSALAAQRGRSADWISGSTANGFTLSGEQALAAKAIDLAAADQPSLLAALDGRTVSVDGHTMSLATASATVETLTPSWWERLRAFVTSPSVAYVLLCFGVLGIFLELASPGGFVAGTIGVACLIAGIYAFSQLPINSLGFGLMALSFVLLGVDLFVSSFGVLTLAGMASFIAGSYLVIDTEIVGYDPVARPVIWTAAALVIILALLVGWTALGSFRQRPHTGKKAMIGEVGIVRKALQPNGMVFLQGELWQATLAPGVDNTGIPVGHHVEVTAVDGLLLSVIAANAEAIAAYNQRTQAPDTRRVLPMPGGVTDLPREERSVT